MRKKMELEEIKECLDGALDNLNTIDSYLLENDLSERSISHKFACYLSESFCEYNVDCEYNSNVRADTGKKYIRLLHQSAAHLGILRDTDDDEIIDRYVYPDIIVHKRGDSDHNLMIIEIKKSSSTVTSDYDYEKLRRYTSPEYENELNYRFGAFICIGVLENTGEHSIEWFQNGEEFDL